jgi:DNA-binding NarL/FixJ family response regulator
MKILVIDDHELIREGLRPVLEQLATGGGQARVLEAHDYARAVEIADANPDLDLVLLDFNLPNVIGFAALVDIQERHPEVPVVVMSGEDDPALMREAFEHGALGFLPKTSTTSVILGALRLVLSGGTYLPREIMGASRSHGAAPAASPGSSVIKGVEQLGITPRQTDVLALLLAGKSNKVICRELNLAEGTVKNHVAAVLKALNANNRVEALIAAGKLGIKA